MKVRKIYRKWALKHSSVLTFVRHINGIFMKKAGGFCKKTIFNEDMILAGHMINAGYKVAYVAEAR